MNWIKIYMAGVIISLMGCNSNSSAQEGKYAVAPAFPNLTFTLPVELTSPDDGSDRIFVVEQKGVIRVFPNKKDVRNATTFLDITSNVVSGGERGLLGLAFHPDFKKNGYFYVNYTHGKPLETIISRFKVSASNPNIADPDSEVILLTYAQPYVNHNGGKVIFGNDKYLYIGVGDGGSGGDPQNNGQNKKVLLGKILRIDVNNTTANTKYSIPADNPFKDNKKGYREEIYAYGLRNPWRFSFDKQTGRLWAGDVGQNKVEEIDIVEKGGNYGWRIMEADQPFKPDESNMEELINPVWSYTRSLGNSVTGGYVSRDKSLPELKGKYIYGDFTSGNVWALTYSGKKAVKNDLIVKSPPGLSSFGEDSKGNLLLLILGEGKIYKIVKKKQI